MNGWGAKRRGKREFRNVKQKISTLVCLTRIFWNREHLWDQSVKIPTTPPSWVSNNQWRMSITSSTSILTSLLALWFIHTFPSVNLVVRLIKSNQRSHLSRSLEQDLSNKRKKKKLIDPVTIIMDPSPHDYQPSRGEEFDGWLEKIDVEAQAPSFEIPKKGHPCTVRYSSFDKESFVERLRRADVGWCTRRLKSTLNKAFSVRLTLKLNVVPPSNPSAIREFAEIVFVDRAGRPLINTGPG